MAGQLAQLCKRPTCLLATPPNHPTAASSVSATSRRLRAAQCVHHEQRASLAAGLRPPALSPMLEQGTRRPAHTPVAASSVGDSCRGGPQTLVPFFSEPT